VKRVFIMDDAEQLLPAYLRFVKGVVDSSDLPLNVSREILQESRDVKAIREGVTKRVLSMLEELAHAETAAETDEGKAKYATFWREFGQVLKEGLAEDFANRDRIAKLVETVPGVKTEIYIPDDGNRYPTLKISWDQLAWGFTLADCVQKLREGDPVIEVLGADNPSLVPAVREGIQKPNRKERKEVDHIELVSMTIQPGEEMIVGQRLRAILGAARKGKPA